MFTSSTATAKISFANCCVQGQCFGIEVNPRSDTMTTRAPPAPPLPEPRSYRGKEVRHSVTGAKQLRKQLEFELVGAIERGAEGEVGCLIERGARLDCVVQWALTPLLLAVQEGQGGVAELLVTLGADVEGVDRLARQWRPLHAAATKGLTHLASMLLERGAKVDSVDGCGMTPLHHACYHGHQAMVKLLLDHGASVHYSDYVQRSALHRAMEGSHLGIARMLLERGCCINSVDKYGWTPLYHCIVFNDVEGARFLIEQGIDLDTLDTFGNTPLHKACDLFKACDVRIITSTSVDFTHRCRRIISPQIRQLVSSQDLGQLSRLAVVELLVNAGAALDALDFYGHTALEYAPDLAITARLVKSGSRITSDMLQGAAAQRACLESETNTEPFEDPLEPGRLIPDPENAGQAYSNKYWYSQYPPWLEEQYERQFRLTGQCRRAIRRTLAHTRDIHSAVLRLPLPSRIKDFLLGKEELQ